MSRGSSRIGNAALISKGHGVYWAGRKRGLGFEAAISDSVRTVSLRTRKAPGRFFASAWEIGSPSRECVEEPSLANDKGRGAFNRLAKSKSRVILVSLLITNGAASVMRVKFVSRAK